MTDEGRIREVRYAELRALRAMRLAMIAMHDSWQDIWMICGLEPDDRDPEQPTRTKAWNLFVPLVLEFADGIKAFVRAPTLGECAIAGTLKECEELINLKEKETRDERNRPLMEELEKLAEEKKRLRQEGRDASGSET